MGKFSDILKYIGFKSAMYAIHHIVPITLIVVAGIGLLYWLNKDDKIEIANEDKTEYSPLQLQSIKNIGEWEFLSINDEEVIDTIRRGFFGDDELARIYYGTLRLGIDTRDLKPGWAEMQKDSMICTLPPIKLLDDHFIDEAKSKSFYEEGKWSQKELELLYQKAYRTMKKRCVTPFNIKQAEDNARLQFIKMMNGFGYQKVRIEFDNTNANK